MATEPQITTVTMTNGRVVDFAGKRRVLKESFVTADNVVSLRLDFINGQTRTIVLPPELLLKFAAHGAEQKFGDEIAGVKDIDDAVMAVDVLADRIGKGQWSVERQYDGMAGASSLARALIEVTGKSADEVRQFLAGKTAADKHALRNSSKVRPTIERLEAEKAARSNKMKINGDELLGELGA